MRSIRFVTGISIECGSHGLCDLLQGVLNASHVVYEFCDKKCRVRHQWPVCSVTGSDERGTNGLCVLLQGVMNAAPMAYVFCYRE